MNKNPSLRKLNLNRETLVPLQASDLDAVNGGTGALCRSIVVASKYACTITVDLATRAFDCNK